MGTKKSQSLAGGWRPGSRVLQVSSLLWKGDLISWEYVLWPKGRRALCEEGAGNSCSGHLSQGPW